MKTFDDKINFIYENTKDCPHSGRSFFEHLINTSNIIKSLFPEDQYLIDAGLFHSIYGTSYYEFDKNISRDTVKSIIGEKSENLVYIFCTLPDRTFRIIQNTFEREIQRDLYILEYANYLEQNGNKKVIDRIKNDLYKNFSIKLP
jgi:hypothetical protein